MVMLEGWQIELSDTVNTIDDISIWENFPWSQKLYTMKTPSSLARGYGVYAHAYIAWHTV